MIRLGIILFGLVGRSSGRAVFRGILTRGACGRGIGILRCFFCLGSGSKENLPRIIK